MVGGSSRKKKEWGFVKPQQEIVGGSSRKKKKEWGFVKLLYM